MRVDRYSTPFASLADGNQIVGDGYPDSIYICPETPILHM